MARAAKLERQGIIDEAILLLNEEGLEGLSLRKLAARLGVQAPALARHVGDKGELLALVSSEIFGHALARIPPDLSGAAWLRGFGLALWQQQQETRDIDALISTAPPSPELDRQIQERIEAMVRSASLPFKPGMAAQQAVQALVTGYNTFARAARAGSFSPPGQIESDFERALDALIAGFDFER